MRILNKHFYELAVIAFMLSAPYSAHALTIEEDETVNYNTNRNNNNLLEVIGTLNNNARLTNSNEILLSGQLNNNSAGRMINTSSGTIENYGNLLNNGVFTNSGQFNHYSAFNNTGEFTNNLNANVYSDGYIKNTQTGNFTNNGDFTSDYMVENFGTLTNNRTMAASDFQNHGTLINGHDGIYQGGGENTGTFQNDGEMNSYDDFKNTGTMTGVGSFTFDSFFLINNGQMTQNNFQINNGSVSGTGIFNGDMTLEAIADIVPDETLTLNGNLTSMGDYYFGFFGGPSAREGKLIVNGEASFNGGSFNIVFSDSYSLSDGLNLTLMTSDSFSGLDNLTYNVNNLSNNWSYNINTTGTNISISISAVPEPESYAMLFVGLLLVRIASSHRKLRLLA